VYLAPAHDGGVSQLAFSPHDKDIFASANGDGFVRMYDRRNSVGPVSQFYMHEGPVYAMAWHPHNRGLLATGGRDKAICFL